MRLFITLLLILLPLHALAGDWRVVPIRLFLDQKTHSDSVRLINSGSTPLNLQVKAALWTQNTQGEDQYQPSDELIFFPRILTVPAGEERILRAGVKLPPADIERTYRLFIEEIPAPKSSGSSAVQIAVRFGLPVFVAPIKPQPVARIDRLALDHGTALVELDNPGNAHLLPTTLTFTGLDAQGNAVFSHPVQPWYLLAGSHRSYKQPLSREECGKAATLRFELGAGELQVSRDIPVTAGSCAP